MARVALAGPPAPASPAPPSPAAVAPAVAGLVTALPDAAAVTAADDLLRRGRLDEAEKALLGQSSPAAALVKARLLLAKNLPDQARVALDAADKDKALALLVQVERGLVAVALGKADEAAALLLPLAKEKAPAFERARDGLVTVLLASAPQILVEQHEVIAAAPRRADDADAGSRLLGAKAEALEKLGRSAEAAEVVRLRYLTEPVSLLTPATPPPGVKLSSAEVLARAEVLAAAHRSERVVEALVQLGTSKLPAAQACQRALLLGLAYRKLRAYADAEAELARAEDACAEDADRKRRAAYLRAKVVSIRDGLRAVPLIDAFAKEYKNHSMVDDVLFWAGDLFQRRAREAEARGYYTRITAIEPKDDQCGEAQWRLSWMSYRKGDLEAAAKGFSALLTPDGCKRDAFDRARAHYWLGRIAQAKGDAKAAAASFSAAFKEEALGWYAQLALTRLQELDAAAAATLVIAPPPAAAPAPLCEGFLGKEGAYVRGRTFLERGLRGDAARELLSIPVPAQVVVSQTHAVAQGIAANPVKKDGGAEKKADRCEHEPRLLLALLLDQAGAFKDAHWRLRTDFAEELAKLPTPDTGTVWRAAYPLAWREHIAQAEVESRLPELLLQALSREESAFDPQVVSWAGAYGLTQLLLTTGQDAGRMVKPAINLTRAEELLDPALNARLGGVMMASLLKRFKGNPALALAAYNAGIDVAAAWWKRHEKDDIDVLGEEMTIQETRGYVKRVLKTYGIYRWLYGGQPPALPIGLTLPARS